MKASSISKSVLVGVVFFYGWASFAEDTITSSSPVTTAEPSTQVENSTQEPSNFDKAKEKVSDAYGQVQSTLAKGRYLRGQSKWALFGNYAPLDLLIPGKYGVSLGWTRGPDKIWELEYLRGKVAVPFIVEDLGKMTDQRLTLMARSFSGNSFNFSYGISYFDFSITLGDKLLNGVSAGQVPYVDVISVQSVGFYLGVGNRWNFPNGFTLGVDWATWAQPVYITNEEKGFLDATTDESDKDEVETALDVVNYFPRLSFLKLNLGWSF
jgi:hypothetical protein